MPGLHPECRPGTHTGDQIAAVAAAIATVSAIALLGALID